MRTAIFRTLLSSLIVVCLQACAIPFPAVTRTVFVESDQLTFLNQTQTRREDVIKELGKPEVTFDDHSSWVYVTKTGFSGGYEYTLGSNDWERRGSEPSNHYLVIHFGPNDSIESWYVKPLVLGECVKDELCWGPSGLLLNGMPVDE